GKAGVRPKMAAQEAQARKQYIAKHFSPLHRAAYATALTLGYVARAIAPGADTRACQRRLAARASLRVLLGADAPPFGRPPGQAVALRAADDADGRQLPHAAQRSSLEGTSI